MPYNPTQDARRLNSLYSKEFILSKTPLDVAYPLLPAHLHVQLQIVARTAPHSFPAASATSNVAASGISVT